MKRLEDLISESQELISGIKMIDD